MKIEPEFITGDWQVRVEVYKDYVLKIAKTIPEIEEQIQKADWTKDFNDKKINAMAIDSAKRHQSSVKAIYDSNAPLELFANPSLLKNGTIKQNRVVIIADILEQNRDWKTLLEKYINSCVKLWEYGLYDTSWNFTLNCGLDEQNTVVFVDVGEFATNFDEISKMINEKQWEKSYSFRQLTKEQQIWFREKSETFLNQIQLKKLWKNKVKSE